VTDDKDAMQYLAFRVANGDFAIPIACVREIVECGAITRVPHAPACVRGVTNLRGTVIPVIDLAIKFGMPEVVLTRFTCIVVVEVDFKGQWSAMGVLADTVTEVMHLGAADVEPPPSFGTRVQSEYLAGLGRLHDQFVLLLDTEKLLSPEELGTTLALPNLDSLRGRPNPDAPRG
jgi:purine-binding chemotaxis protein CheW